MKLTYIGTAAGRVNLIGEHTDYNGGYVLPTVIPQQTRVVIVPRSDCLVRIESANIRGSHSSYEYELGKENRTRSWSDYVQGITYLLSKKGYSIRGFEAEIHSQVPIGSGLSSSAALDVSLIRGLRAAFNLSIDDVDIAKLSQQVENQFVGAQVGIMDPMSVSLGSPGQALFLDARTLNFKQIKLPLEKMDLLVINSGVSHSNPHGGGYNERRSQCEKACQILGIRLLRELHSSDLPIIKHKLPIDLFIKVRHVVTENERVLAAVKAIENENIEELGHLFYESHISMKDDYNVSIPEIDFLVKSTEENPEVLGARLTGGGFGGSVVILTLKGKSEKVGKQICSKYQETFGVQPRILIPLNIDP